MRMVEIATVLGRVGQPRDIVWRGNDASVEGARTYKKPRQKTPSRDMRCPSGRFRHHSTFIGKAKMIMSVMIFPAALVYHWATIGVMQTGLRLGSQNPAT